MSAPADRTNAPDTIRVWDVVVRFTHWSVAAIICFDLVQDSGDKVHRTLGYIAAGLVLFRVLWGFIGSQPARFRTWLPRPSAMLAMWALILALAVTGWISRLDAFWGEDLPVDIHRWLANGLLALVILHVAAAIVMSIKGRENLVAAMITGRKPGDPHR